MAAATEQLVRPIQVVRPTFRWSQLVASTSDVSDKQVADAKSSLAAADFASADGEIQAAISDATGIQADVPATLLNDKPNEFRWQDGFRQLYDSKLYFAQVADVRVGVRVCVSVCKGDTWSKFHVRAEAPDFEPAASVDLRSYESGCRAVLQAVMVGIKRHYKSALDGKIDLDETQSKTIRMECWNSESEELKGLFDTYDRLKRRVSLMDVYDLPQHDSIRVFLDERVDPTGFNTERGEEQVVVYSRPDAAMFCRLLHGGDNSLVTGLATRDAHQLSMRLISDVATAY